MQRIYKYKTYIIYLREKHREEIIQVAEIRENILNLN